MLDRILPLAGVVLVCAGALSFMAPSGDAAEAIAINTDETQTTAFTSHVAQAQSGTVWDAASGHTLTRQRDGHFYASARIEGRGVHMMVDTGASVIALTGQDARAVGLSWSDSDVQPVARGASGTVYGVRTMLRDVEIGGMKRRNIQAIIVPRGLDVSLLGQSYLSQIGTVEISNNQMVLSAD